MQKLVSPRDDLGYYQQSDIFTNNIDHKFEIDSLVESAFCSEANTDWEKYKLSVGQPQVSEIS